MIELLKISEIIFYEKLILAGIIAGIIVFGGTTLSLLLLYLGISREV